MENKEIPTDSMAQSGKCTTKTKPTKREDWKIILFVFIYIIAYGISLGVFINKADNCIWDKQSELINEAEKSLDNFTNKLKTTDRFVWDDINISTKFHFLIDVSRSNNNLRYNEPSDNLQKYGLNFPKSITIDPIFNGREFFVVQQWFPNDEIGTSIITYNLFVNRIEYKRQMSWMPSVQECVERACDFLINNSKSGYASFYEKGSQNMLDNFIDNFENEYYYLGTEEIGNIDFYAYNPFSGFSVLIGDYAEMNFGTRNAKIYKIMQKDSKINKDEKELKTKGIIIISCIFIGIITLHIFLYRRNKGKLEK